MMEDFNADNAEIDAAIAAEQTARVAEKAALESKIAVAGETELLRSAVSDGTVNQIVLNVSTVNWSRYAALLLHVSLPSANGVQYLRCNGGGYNSAQISSGGDSAFYVNYTDDTYHGLIFLARNPDVTGYVLNVGKSLNLGALKAKIKDCQTLSLVSASTTANLYQSTKFSLWGVR